MRYSSRAKAQLAAAVASEKGAVTAEFVILIPVICFLLGFCLMALQAQFLHQRIHSVTNQAGRILQTSGQAEATLFIKNHFLTGTQGTSPKVQIENSNQGSLVCLHVEASENLLGMIPVTSVAKSCVYR